jgi:EAL domain-containing protein (putative c-di-GMP-specific phosphodiesterase class I)
MANDSATPARRADTGSTLDIPRALADDRFFLVYQPTIEIQSGGFAGVESLIRLRQDDGGTLGPDAFLSALEASGEIVAVGRWALAMACHQGALWHAKGYRFTVSVNVSAGQFADPAFLDDVAAALRASRFDPALLLLEFAQTTLLDDTASPARLAALAGLGVRIAVDDFSLGTSSLDALAGLPVTTVKLSRASLTSVPADGLAARVHALVNEARARHLQIVASGVEDSGQRRLLQSEDVALAQGFLFSRPREAGDIDQFLEDFALFSGKPL